MNNTASTRPALAPDSRRQPGRRLSVAVVALATVCLGVFSATEGFTAVGLTVPAPNAPVVAAVGSDDPITGDFSRFALNALLVPLLDDAEPPRWTDVGLNLFCGPATRVEVNGKPLVPGTQIPATAFTVRWHMDQCFPMDYSAVELSGTVELLVFHEDTGLSAVVSADRLRVSSAKGTSRLSAPFAASMSFAVTVHRP